MKYEKLVDEIIMQYYESIFKYCYVRLKNENDASDCTQEVFAVFCKKAGKLRLNENIRAWLYRTADNVIKSFRRKNKAYISLDDISEIPDKTDFEAAAPLEDIISEDEYRLLKAYYIDKVGIELIAEKLGISKDAAFKRIYRLKARIVKYMGNFNKKQ